MTHRTFSLVLMVIAISGPWLAGTTFADAPSGTLTLENLLDDLTDLPRLTRLPVPAYITKQYSSYDQASKSPADAEAWFANGDRGQFIREESKDGRKEYVMADMDGPGVIVRIWSANPEGVMRVYIDGEVKPAIEAPMSDILGGSLAGMPLPLAGKRAMGWNLYLPIPYAKHCKVTSDESKFYYHVNYRTYPVGTKVESFAMADLLRLKPKVDEIADKLGSPRMKVPPPADRVRKPFTAKLQPDGQQVLFEATGSKAICGFLMHLAAKDIEAAARAVVVYMTFDGEETVECPLGDFFGTAPGLTSYASLPLGITEGAKPDLWCHWYMPFAKDCSIRVKNLGDQEVELDGAVATIPYKWDERSLLFHAGWRGEKQVPSRPFTDWVHLECAGNGRFVGGALHIQNPVRGWWGEGDEKIYVDGETFPSHFGTGTEDYYGYAWCSPERFVHAFHNQPRCDGPGNYGNSSVNRFHIIDDIPFTKQFKFDIENWHSNKKTTTNRAAISYWYARPGGKDFFKPITKEDVKLEVMPPLKLSKVKDAQEGESLKPVDKTGGKREKQDMIGQEGKWSDMKLLCWVDAKPGDKMTLEFESPEAGTKNVIVGLSKAPNYGIVQVYINGAKAGEPVDLYDEKVAPMAPIDLGKFDLAKGQNKITLEIVGANDKAAKMYRVGLDYLLVK